MREIKFRAWHNEAKKMLFGEKSHYPLYWKEEGQPVELMQFTGLKDRKGNEIYEGDLLRSPAKGDWEKDNYVVFEVFYHDNDCADRHIGFQFNRLHFQGSVAGYSMMENFLPMWTKKMEVIGNIYENTDLLK